MQLINLKAIDNLDKRLVRGFLALSILVSAGFVAFAHASDGSAKSSPAAEQEVRVNVHKGNTTAPQSHFDLNARINKMRESAPKLSLPTNMFEPWWQTMFKDPDSEWLMRNFDIMSSDPERSWAFPLGTGSYIPRVDIDTTDNLLKLTAEVPGIDEKNLDVTVTDEAVSIKGEKQAEEKKTNSKDFQSIERHYGSFERTVALPCKIDKDKAEAKLKNGILTVTLPRLLEEKSPAKRLTIGRQ